MSVNQWNAVNQWNQVAAAVENGSKYGTEMIQIECEKCNQRFWVEGYTTADSLDEPGEVVLAIETREDCHWDEVCDCLKAGGDYEITDEEHDYYHDD